ncbi:succinate dehydrogenase, hydrophobic membrane anchor protein [Sulfuriferula nivalis]|uniref:Succinate dehydrogenase hydrophobic membrane anchor subunit n=1 Tax=Sulfuriferula nivalis TaxID=2675298 RepID=A0A809SG63_9PROT|nr:succinate dehydrogenase, hydrophobic membrane anchor protein [Sulfuriferula nivalis]BBO99649.1 succinate dehydrogenase, hydrophobic membrane anchor protein [Sulfuriferula nivalis]
MVDRIVSGAHYGLKDWLAQRVTAVVMALYSLFMVGYLLLQPVLDYAAWHTLFHSQPVRLVSLLFVLSLLLHAWVGMRDIFMDYVHPTLIRLALHVAVILALVVYAAWAVQILWSGL